MHDVDHYLAQLQECLRREKDDVRRATDESSDARVGEEDLAQEPKREPLRAPSTGESQNAGPVVEMRNALDSSGAPGRAELVFVAALQEELDAITRP